MTPKTRSARPLLLARRSALLGSAALLSGCSLYDNLFTTTKPRLPGEREAVRSSNPALPVDAASTRKVTLPTPVMNAAWPQPGGNPAHAMGHLQVGDNLNQVWSSAIGEGGGYRRKILCQPVTSATMAYTMDSDGVISAFDAQNGSRRWQVDLRRDNVDSTNVGGGVSLDHGVLYAVNGLGDVAGLDAGTGHVNWTRNTGIPARSSPTIADGRMFYVTLDDRLLALDVTDGRQLWSYQAPAATTSLLGQPAPAYADGLVVAGFGSGELACLRAESGGVAWTDSLAAASVGRGLSALSAIRGLPVIVNGRVYAIGLGSLCVGIDLRSGRRLWEREIAGSDNPCVAGDWLFVTTSMQQLAALSREDGVVGWVMDLPQFEDEEKQKDPIHWYGPTLAGDRLIVVGTNGQALAVSPYTGKIVGRQTLPGAASLAPIVAAGTVYLITDNASLLAFR